MGQPFTTLLKFSKSQALLSLGDLQLLDSIVNNPAQNGNVVLLNLSVLCFLIRLEGLDKLLLQTGQADPHAVLQRYRRAQRTSHSWISVATESIARIQMPRPSLEDAPTLSTSA